MHLDTILSHNLNGKTEKTENTILYDEEFILLSDSRLIKDTLFCTFSVTVAI